MNGRWFYTYSLAFRNLSTWKEMRTCTSLLDLFSSSKRRLKQKPMWRIDWNLFQRKCKMGDKERKWCATDMVAWLPVNVSRSSSRTWQPNQKRKRPRLPNCKCNTSNNNPVQANNLHSSYDNRHNHPHTHTQHFIRITISKLWHFFTRLYNISNDDGGHEECIWLWYINDAW